MILYFGKEALGTFAVKDSMSSSKCYPLQICLNPSYDTVSKYWLLTPETLTLTDPP